MIIILSHTAQNNSYINLKLAQILLLIIILIIYSYFLLLTKNFNIMLYATEQGQSPVLAKSKTNTANGG